MPSNCANFHKIHFHLVNIIHEIHHEREVYRGHGDRTPRIYTLAYVLTVSFNRYLLYFQDNLHVIHS